MKIFVGAMAAAAMVGSAVGGGGDAPQPLSFQAEYVGVVPVASSTLSEVRVGLMHM